MTGLHHALSLVALSAQSSGTSGDPQIGGNPVSTVLLLGVLSLLPFLLMMITSFLKFSVVLSIIRVALGTQQIPPTPVVMGLSIVLTLYVMAPLGGEIYRTLETELVTEDSTETLSAGGARTLLASLGKTRDPLRDFLRRHAHDDDIAVFLHQAHLMAAAREGGDLTEGGDGAADDGAGVGYEEPSENDLMVLIPAFAISELAEAFAIGFLIFLPFLIIDMVVSNILLAMGMHMLSPVVVSLPFKMLLFIMVDGWRLLTQGLMQPYLL